MNYYCAYCEREIFNGLSAPSKRVLKTKDHIIPISKGGKNYFENKVDCCYQCNSIKSNLSLTEFIKVVSSLSKQEVGGNYYNCIPIVMVNADNIRKRVEPRMSRLVHKNVAVKKKKKNTIVSKEYPTIRQINKIAKQVIGSQLSVNNNRSKNFETATEFLKKREMLITAFNLLNAPEENFHEPD